MVFQNDIIAGASGAGGGYTIDQSIRFNDDDTAYLTRTPSSNGNRQTFTWSGWVKIGAGAIASNSYLLATTGGGNDSGYFTFYINQTYNSLNLTGYNTVWKRTAQVFRDPSAWYHIVIRVDSTNATADDRIRIYVNGEQVTSFQTSSNPALNHNFGINTTSNTTYLFSESTQAGGPTSDKCWDGYGAEINFVDGQALAPADFGETNDDGMWVPKAYAGTYGTNGFYLKGQDSSNLGDDSSGNGNDFTSSGLTSDDQVSDSPTLNFPVISPIDYQTGSNVTISNGNLTFQNANSGSANDARATFAVSSGKWYWEVEADSLGQSGVGREFIGVVSPEWPLGTGSAGSNFSQDSTGYAYNTVGQKINSGSASSYGSSLSAGDIVGVALDLDNGKIWWSVNGTFQASGDPAAGTNEAYSGLSGTFAPAFAVDYGVATSRLIANFGQTGGLTYTPPTGFSQIDSSTLPEPTITDGSAYFQTSLYTGTGSSLAVNQSGNSVFQPDFVWIKKRSGTDRHELEDAVRGATNRLSSDRTDAEDTGGLTSFDSDGFTVDGLYGSSGESGFTYAAWQWLAANGTASNTDGSITSTVSVNTTAGFSIVSYSGAGVIATVGHGLGAVPGFFVVKKRTSGTCDYWPAWHPALTLSYIALSNNYMEQGSDPSVFNNTDPTSTSFTVGQGANSVNTNGSGSDYIAYCFAEVEGFSRISSYTGNGSADGPFMYCGFRPAWIMIRRYTSNGAWTIFDNQREGYNVDNDELVANTTAAETTTDYVDILSNGFKLRSTDADVNTSGGGYIFMAFAEHPFGGDGVAPATAR